MRFIDRCHQAWAQQQSQLCVGLDPDLSRLPTALQDLPTEQAVEAFCTGIIEATAAHACAFKPQIAYFASLGLEAVLERLGAYVREQHPQHLWILDSKRGDIGSTAEHYAREAFERFQADAVTISPYMGGDSIAPFLKRPEHGVFLLCRTSNAGGDDLQMQTLASGERLFERVARLTAETWAPDGQGGLVVGATYPAEVARVRAIAPQTPLLIPGVGAQGGDLAATVQAAGTPEGGFFLNSSRAILYASAGPDWQAAAARVAAETQAQIQAARFAA